MPFIYDNLIATLISMTVLLILASIQTQATQTNTARTSRNTVKAQAQQMATWMEEDLAEIGKNMNVTEAAFENPQNSTDWHTTQLTFKYESLLASGGTERVKVRYELEKTGTRTVDGTDEILFEVQRSQKVGDDPWTSEGQSPGSLEYYEVNMLDKNGAPVPNPKANRDEVESFRIRFSVIAPFQSESTFPRRVRRSIVVPYRLARK
jgi:Tfp pilus assembly protein PilE